MEIDLTKWHRCEVDKKQFSALIKKSDWPGIKHVFIYFLSLLFFGYLAFITWGTWWSLAFFLIYGNIYAFSNPIWHEAGHKTAFKSNYLNNFFYHIGSFMANFEPTRWRWTHFRHHSNTLFTKDPYDFEIEIAKPTDLLFFITRLIPGGNVLFFHKSPVFETMKHAFGITTDVMEESIPDKEKSKCRFVSRIHVLIWISTIISSIVLQSWLPLLYFLLPGWYGNTLFELCGVTQHAGLRNDIKDHRYSTRTVYLNPIFSFLYWHMEYHIEHHMFPTVPSYNLPKLHTMIKDRMPPVKKGLWGAYSEIIPAILKQSRDPNYKINLSVPN